MFKAKCLEGSSALTLGCELLLSLGDSTELLLCCGCEMASQHWPRFEGWFNLARQARAALNCGAETVRIMGSLEA